MFDHANKLHMYCICDSRAPVAHRIPRRIRRAPIGPAFAQQGSSENLGTAWRAHRSRRRNRHGKMGFGKPWLHRHVSSHPFLFFLDIQKQNANQKHGGCRDETRYLGLFGEYMCSFSCCFRFCGVSVSLNELHKKVQISFGLVQGWDYPQRKYDWIKSFDPFLSIS